MLSYSRSAGKSDKVHHRLNHPFQQLNQLYKHSTTASYLAMSGKLLSKTCQFSVAAFLLLALLFWQVSTSFLGSVVRQITAVFLDPSTQWMGALCLVVYYITFLIIEHRLSLSGKWWRLSSANFWLSIFLVLALLRYTFAYQTASNPTQIPIFLAGIVFGKAISVYVRWQNEHAEQRIAWLVSLLLCLLACATLWQPEMATAFQYHGASRWNGVWYNPNLYGLLMGVGTILAIDQIFGTQRWKMADGRWRQVLRVILYSVAAVLCGIGLFKSYSRGAWLGAACGLAYLIAKSAGKNHNLEIAESAKLSHVSWFKTNRFPLFVIMVSVLALSFWQFRFLELRPAQRVFSVTNVNDFSWRNRVTAWEGALQIMAEHPWLGVGWNQPEPLYQNYYLPPKLTESGAIEMNDYLMLGATLGLPALFCFGMYIWLSLTQNPESRIQNPELLRTDWLQTICRAGAIVLLVGFWFDGGLFKLPTAAIFWILLELGNAPISNRKLSV